MANNISQPPKVFISYSWDSPKHKDDVLNLADRLRNDGIDCNIDQYEVSPPEGWPRWMSNQVDESDFVLVICTEQYQRRFQGKEEPGKGKGVTWEGAIINQVIYDYDKRKKTKFIPIIFSSQQANYIPREISGFTNYLLDTENLNLDSNEAYEALYRHLTNQPLHKKSKLGKWRSMPPRQRQQDDYRKDREYELEEIQQKKLTELYDRARRLRRARQWKKVIAIFQQMQEENLPYFDPDGLYRLAVHNQLVQERENWNLYNQGVRYFQTKDWNEARKKFEAILRRKPNDRNLSALAQEKLAQVQEKLEREKWLSIGLIAIGWLISIPVGITGTESAGGIGGFVSGAVIWWVSQRTKQLEPSQQVLQLILFIFIGVVAGVILCKIIKELPLPYEITTFIGGAIISVSVMFWQIRRQVFGV
ncbi:MAG: TIR domain-containing protein [Pleurocapsa sp. MO_226.B13]|nr:TIR domain-containing protein [Pleurocapsa sp. MO_226.B13]